MYEFEKYEAARHASPVGPADETLRTVGEVEAMSLLIWGEHCIECAAPACYTTCDLFEARPDLRCRRFAYGLYRNPNFSSVRPYGVELRFKKWGKLETRGNTRMLPTGTLTRRERQVAALQRVVDALGRVAYAVFRRLPWRYVAVPLGERICRRAHRRRERGGGNPDAFLLEVYNPGHSPVRMMVEMSVAKIELPAEARRPDLPAFTTGIELPTGYSRHEFEHHLLAPVTDSGLPFDISLIPEADNEATLVILTSDFVRFRPAPGGRPPDIKCVVWDLDHTVWNGVLIEGDDVQVRPGVREAIIALDERGILHSVASKNDHETAWAKLEELGLAEYFLHPQIHWNPKSASVGRIAESLNIGLDTFAFIDDNAFEREEVAATYPDVLCLDLDAIAGLADAPRFAGSESADARKRRGYYRDAIHRESVRVGARGSAVDFLKTCEIKLQVDRFAEADFDRVAELVQRTNQLNFSGRKYSRDSVREIVDGTTQDGFVLRCSDRFGDYGTVGFAIVRQSGRTLCIDDFMLSCRVQGKYIEQAFFAALLSAYADVDVLSVNFTPTERNEPARQVLERMGFGAREGGGMTLDVSAGPVQCDCVNWTLKA